MKKLLNRFAKWLIAKTCEHIHRKTMYVDYQEGYVKEQCSDCKQEIYSDYE